MTRRAERAARAMWALTAAGAIGTGAPAQPAASGQADVGRLVDQLTGLETSLRDAGLAPGQRVELLDRAFEARARLITLGAEDDRASTWMVDQAAAMLDRLSLDGTEASVLLGIPTAARRERAQAEAWGALQLVAKADDHAGRQVRRLQSRVLDAPGRSPEEARLEAARIEAQLSRLIDGEQAVRIPYYRGRAAALLAALETGGGNRAAREDHGRVAMESVGRLMLESPAGEATRRVALGAVLLALWPRDEKPRAEARELFEWVARRPGGVAAAGPSPMAMAEAWMGLTRCSRGEEQIRAAVAELAGATRREPFVVAGKTDPLLAMLAAEAMAATMLSDQPRVAAARRAWQAEALAPLVALLTREDLREADAALRSAAMAAIAAACELAGPGLAYDQLDPRIGFARGIALAQEAVRPGAPPAGAASQAVTLLEQVAVREDAGDIRASALWELAVMRSLGPGAADAADAVGYLCRLAREFPESDRAGEAASKAVELSRFTIARLAKEKASAPDLPRRVGELYGQSLELAYKLHPTDPDAPRWRVERARQVVESVGGAGGSLTPEQLDTVLGALEGVRGGEPGAQARVLGTGAVESALRAARETGAPAVARVARRAVQWAQATAADRPSLADGYRLILGEALLDGGDTRAMAIYEELGARAGSAPAPESWRIRLGTGRAQRLAGRPGDGFATLRALVEDIDQTPAPGADAATTRGTKPAEYWAAWAEMLEILGADNADGRRTPSIRSQIGRLRLLSPELGGEATRARIEAAGAGP